MTPTPRFAAACALVLVTASVASLQVSADSARPDAFVGEALNRQGRLQYREFHDFSTSRGEPLESLTIYRDPNGREIARMQADYRASRTSPQYRMVDHRFDSEESAVQDGLTVHMMVRHGERVRRKSVTRSAAKDMVIGPGFNELIRARWDDLVAGATIRCDFALPARLQVVPFRIRRDPRHDTPSTFAFTVDIDNALLRLVAPSLRVAYERSTKRLARYEGLSNVVTDDDRSQEVVIHFPEGARANNVAPPAASAIASH